MGRYKAENKPILLSLDADFWSFEDFLWDWQHSERLPAEVLWAARFQSCLVSGIDLVHETRPERADLHPLKTVLMLREAGWQFSKHCQVTVSDSHVHAFPAFASVANARIVNFDAHHDLGYVDRASMQKRWKSEYLQCEDWLWFLLRQRRSLDAVTVYPSWKCQDGHLGDWPQQPHWKGTSVGERVRGVAYCPEVLEELAGEVTHIHVARSGTWLPPWHDEIVPDLIAVLMSELGLRQATVYGKVDPSKCRNFDIEGHRKQAQMIAEICKQGTK